VHGRAPALLAASDVAGFVLFGVFLVALVVLGVVTVTWAVRRDRAGRRRMMEEQEGEAREPTAGEGP